ncbi:MAG: acetyl-CoA carboxylase biotin carboxylase subunit [Myxococcales bacterium]|nr:acetyl-CoA carboxylase biotin carboxylase subunit [Myxococcales bacterium]MCB9521102.1 acetyl-CoA carboxylase biotin carboxylase subunit [Myxococcales bacterium]
MFDKVLIANRGEIAVRVMRTLRELGIGSVAVYSEADARALHVRYADEAYCVGPAASAESYLRMDRILEVAARTGAQAIHPGYGFLSENAKFAEACAAAGVTFIGPPPSAIVAMGEKTQARRIMMAAGVPVVPGTEHPIPTAEEALEIARGIGFPVLVKAAAGGGGKGMRRVDRDEDFLAAFAGAQREAQNAFGNGDCYIEKWIVRPKHVEIQVLADTLGGCVHLFERECSVQRRHQKVVEESPCPVLRPDVRAAMGEVAVRAARAVDYVGAGTCEFLIDVEQNFYFLEMNTRLQVEHPITEAVTGVDLVEQQLAIAAGRPLPFTQEDLSQRGHAIEIRVYAEDPANNFLPSPGTITELRVPQGHGVRDDGGFYAGAEVTPFYDPMIAKFIVHGEDREKARKRMLRCLDEYVVQGVETNIDFLKSCLSYPDFVDGSYDTGVVSGILAADEASSPAPESVELARIAAAVHRHLHASQAATSAPAAAAAESPWLRAGRIRSMRSIQ